MFKTRVIKAKVVEEARAKYGDQTVSLIFEKIQMNPPEKVLEELDDDSKSCLIFLLGEGVGEDFIKKS